jgi:DNA-binding GntR family transcriptional regulator
MSDASIVPPAADSRTHTPVKRPIAAVVIPGAGDTMNEVRELLEALQVKVMRSATERLSAKQVRQLANLTHRISNATYHAWQASEVLDKLAGVA